MQIAIAATLVSLSTLGWAEGPGRPGRGRAQPGGIGPSASNLVPLWSTRIPVDISIHLEQTLRSIQKQHLGTMVRDATATRRTAIREAPLWEILERRAYAEPIDDGTPDRARLEAARIHAWSGAPDLARKACDALAREHGDDWTVQAWRCDLPRNRKDRARLVTELRKRTKTRADDPTAFALLARLRRPDAARVLFARVAKRWPKFAPGWVGLSHAESARENFPAAQQAAERALALTPRSAAAHDALGRAECGLGQVSRAERSWRRSLQLDPMHISALQALAHSYASFGNGKNARSWIKKARRAAPALDMLALQHAAIELMFRRAHEAVFVLRHAVAPMGPANTELHRWLARAYLQAELTGLATLYARRAAAVKPRFQAAHQTAAFVALGAGQFADAARSYEVLFRLGAKDADTMFFAAVADGWTRNLARAKRRILRAVARDPNNLAYRVVSAAILEFSRDRKGAAMQYRRIVRDAPKHAHSWARLAFLTLDRCDRDAANKAFGRATSPSAYPEAHTDIQLAAAIFYELHGENPEAALALYRRYQSRGGSHPAVANWIKRVETRLEK